MFKYGKIYTHKRMLDAAVYVLNSWSLINGDHKLHILWFNRRKLNLGISEYITVDKNEVINWYEI